MKEDNKRRALGMGLEQLFNTEMLDFENISAYLWAPNMRHLKQTNKK